MPLFSRNKNRKVKYQKGFTFIELIVVFGIITLLFSIGFISISRMFTSSTTNASIVSVISDIKTQQIKAMVGDTEGNGTPDTHGVKILNNSYVLFHGASYDPQSNSNFEVPAPVGYTFSTTFPNQTIIFSLGSGEIKNFNNNLNSITLTNTTSNITQSIEFNKLGTITTINQ